MIGKELNHYTITAKIGEGGMGAVYAAEDSKLGRRVALKVLPPELAHDPERLERFQREARSVAALNHPNIVVLYSVEESDGTHFLTMELVEGQPLSELIPEDGLPLETLLDDGIALTEALSVAHDRGITHRDLKPANVMVNSEGRVKVLDFGLAKIAQQPGEAIHTQTPTEALTEEGRVLGTTPYMSPEQLAGKQLDARSDIFSLGIVLYEMATGSRPFLGDTPVSTITAILQETPPAVSTVRGSLPVALDPVISRCLEKDPVQRFQTMAELRDALNQLRQDPRQKSSRSAKRFVVAALVLAAVTIGAFLLSPKADEAPRPAPQTQTELSRGPSIAVLPFENASGDPEQDYFSNGLTEELITELSKFQDLSVIARTSTLEYADRTVDIREVGDELGVRYLLQGSVQKAGDNVRITAQLSDSVEGTQLWGESYDRSLTASDFFGLQDEVTLSVVNAIAGSYGALFRAELAQARRKAPSTLGSYDCVLRAYEYMQSHTPGNHLMARDCLESVIEADPDYADAKAWLAYIYSEEYHHRWNARPDQYDALERAQELGEEAVRLDPTSQAARGCLSLNLFLLGDYDRARVEARRAGELNPGNALWMAIIGLYLVQIGDLEEGMESMRAAMRLSPHPPTWFSMTFFYDHYLNGRFEEALAAAHRLDNRADFRIPLFVAAAYGQLGHLEEAGIAIKELEAMWTLPLEEIRIELIERHAFSPELTDALLRGLVKGGVEDVWGVG